jgi:hypothetical protein
MALAWEDPLRVTIYSVGIAEVQTACKIDYKEDRRKTGNEGRRVNSIRKEGKATWLGDAAKRKVKKNENKKSPGQD